MGVTITSPIKRLGAWLSRNTDTVYQAETDGFVLGTRKAPSGSMEVKTDGSNPPTITRKSTTPAGDTQDDAINVPVRKGDYWEITNATHYIFWIPLLP